LTSREALAETPVHGISGKPALYALDHVVDVSFRDTIVKAEAFAGAAAALPALWLDTSVTSVVPGRFRRDSSALRNMKPIEYTMIPGIARAQSPLCAAR
jgi:hypothetical protein